MRPCDLAFYRRMYDSFLARERSEAGAAIPNLTRASLMARTLRLGAFDPIERYGVLISIFNKS